ncbi:uncharacterized protein IL334_007822 [Kwoniella shivajii]|uniref:Tyrosine specific protein phosphatases domain-containing protein n=1 Tax=Kwoniella shivajii TaxID=564305 RepID=A0ABZ1D9R4_9TREE|nr:hypothetical protein IL334_007822 [Kwoniella shivajii]
MDHLPLKMAKQERRDSISSNVSELLLGQEDVVRVHHYHFDAWPDHGVPEGKGVEALSKLVEEVEQRKESLDCELIVSSAGVGRTGTFIALSSLRTPGQPSQPSALQALPQILQEDPVAKTVDMIRECRGMLVQNPDQLRLIYEMH